jgi:hypothetical protein
MHSLSGIPTHDPSVRAGENMSCLKPRGQRDKAPKKENCHKNEGG